MDEIPRWLARMRGVAGPGGLDALRADSLRYGLLMRKFQAEAYRREVPHGGYVITVIRDIPNASMGLLDYLNQPKWTEADWAWQRDTICLLKTDNDARSFAAGDHLRGAILLSHFGLARIDDGELRVTLETASNPPEVLQRREEKGIRQNTGTLARLMELDWALPPGRNPVRSSSVRNSAPPTASSTTIGRCGSFRSRMPARPPPCAFISSLADELARELFAGARPFRKGDPNGVWSPPGWMTTSCVCSKRAVGCCCFPMAEE